MKEEKYQHLILVVLGGLAAIGPFSVDMYLPGFGAIARDLNTSGSLVGLTLTSYTLGIAFGQLLAGPILDRYGRRKPILISLLLFVFAAVGCAFAPSIHLLILFRFFLALGSCVGMVGANTIVRDLFSGSDIARALSVMMMVFGVAPVIAPTIGGIVVSLAGWRAIFGVLMIIGILVAMAVQFMVPETKGRDNAISLHPVRMAGQYTEVFRDRHFCVFATVGGLAAGMLFTYITGSPAVLLDTFHFTAREFGWIFGGIALGLTLSNMINRLLLRRLSMVQVMLLALSVQSVVALVLFLGLRSVFFDSATTIALIGFYIFCLGFVMPNATALVLQPFSRNAGSASGLSGSMSMLLGTVASALASYFYNGTGTPMAIMFVILSVTALVIVGVSAFTGGQRHQRT